MTPFRHLAIDSKPNKLQGQWQDHPGAENNVSREKKRLKMRETCIASKRGPSRKLGIEFSLTSSRQHLRESRHFFLTFSASWRRGKCNRVAMLRGGCEREGGQVVILVAKRVAHSHFFRASGVSKRKTIFGGSNWCLKCSRMRFLSRSGSFLAL